MWWGLLAPSQVLLSLIETLVRASRKLDKEVKKNSPFFSLVFR